MNKLSWLFWPATCASIMALLFGVFSFISQDSLLYTVLQRIIVPLMTPGIAIASLLSDERSFAFLGFLFGWVSVTVIGFLVGLAIVWLKHIFRTTDHNGSSG